MGYTTDFRGQFNLDRPLAPEHHAYLAAFSRTRRMRRDADLAAALPDPIRVAAGLPIGLDGGYFVGNVEHMGQVRDESIIEYNDPPWGQPGLWCQWTPNDSGTAIEWDGQEKFSSYVKWLRYLVEHFLGPWGYTLNGEVEWFGEDEDDRGKIVVTDNLIEAKRARIVYE